MGESVEMIRPISQNCFDSVSSKSSILDESYSILKKYETSMTNALTELKNEVSKGLESYLETLEKQTEAANLESSSNNIANIHRLRSYGSSTLAHMQNYIEMIQAEVSMLLNMFEENPDNCTELFEKHSDSMIGCINLYENDVRKRIQYQTLVFPITHQEIKIALRKVQQCLASSLELHKAKIKLHLKHTASSLKMINSEEEDEQWMPSMMTKPISVHIKNRDYKSQSNCQIL